MIGFIVYFISPESGTQTFPPSTTVDGERGELTVPQTVAGRVNDSNGSTRLDGLMLSGGVWWTVRALWIVEREKDSTLRRGEALALQTWGIGKTLGARSRSQWGRLRAGTVLFWGFFPRDEIWDLRNISIPFSNRATHNSGNGLDSHDGCVVCSDELGRTASCGSCVNAIHADGIDQLIKQIHRWIDKLQH